MDKPNLTRIDLWSIRLKSMVIVSSIFFILILGFFIWLRPSLEKKEKIYLSLQSFDKELNNQLKISTKYLYYMEKIKNIRKKFDINYNDSIDQVILNILSGQLTTPGFKINKINFLSNKKQFLNSLQIESDFFNANNISIRDFLYQISRLNKLIVISKFRWKLLNVLSKNQKYNIVFLFKVYIQNFNSKKLISALSEINKTGAKSMCKFNNLTKYPLNKLKMLGFLSLGNDQNWGIVGLPNKQICKLKLGDYVGLEQALVIGAYSHEILIQDNNKNKIFKLIMDDKKFSDVKNSA